MHYVTPEEISNAIHTDRRRKRRVRVAATLLLMAFYLTLFGLVIGMVGTALGRQAHAGSLTITIEPGYTYSGRGPSYAQEVETSYRRNNATMACLSRGDDKAEYASFETRYYICMAHWQEHERRYAKEGIRSYD